MSFSSKKRPFFIKIVNFDTVPIIGNGIIKFGSDENNFFLQIFWNHFSEIAMFFFEPGGSQDQDNVKFIQIHRFCIILLRIFASV